MTTRVRSLLPNYFASKPNLLATSVGENWETEITRSLQFHTGLNWEYTGHNIVEYYT